MAITISGPEGGASTAVLSGVCPIEEAEILLDWLRKTDSPAVDLLGCEHMHMAVLQTLLALRPRIVAMVPDPLLRGLLGGASDISGSVVAGKDS